MKTYRITEIAVYYVKAEDHEQAEDIFLNSDNPNEFFDHVEDRDVTETLDRQ